MKNEMENEPLEDDEDRRPARREAAKYVSEKKDIQRRDGTGDGEFVKRETGPHVALIIELPEANLQRGSKSYAKSAL